MKRYEFELPSIDTDKFIYKPIRRKEDIINLLMNSVKLILQNNIYQEEILEPSGKMVLIISKMSRLFYFLNSGEKYFSINFPFTVIEKDDKLSFSSKYIDEIDTKICFDILSLLSCNQGEESTCVTDILEPLTDENDYHEDIGTLVKELLFMEDGYIRYDYDFEHQNGNLHPLNHFDLCYSNKVNFKIGLNSRIDYEFFIDLLKLETDCKYIN